MKITKKQALRAFRDALKEDWGAPLMNDADARRFELAFAEALKWALQGAPAVSIPGLGTFRRTTRKARRIRGVRSDGAPGPAMMLPETHSIRFSPCGEWRRSLK